MHQDDQVSYRDVKQSIQEGNLDSAILAQAHLSQVNCDELLALLQKMQADHEKVWQAKRKILKSNRSERQPHLITDLQVYQRLLKNLDSEQDDAKNYYEQKKTNLLLFEASLRRKKHQVIQLEYFERYKESLENYLYMQVERLNRHAPQSYKREALEDFIQDCKNIRELSQFSELKTLSSKIREVTHEHRDPYFSWRYFLKFNWLRNPTSYNSFIKIFNRDDELLERKKPF